VMPALVNGSTAGKDELVGVLVMELVIMEW